MAGGEPAQDFPNSSEPLRGKGGVGGDISKRVKLLEHWEEQKPSIRACLKWLRGVRRKATTEGGVSSLLFCPLQHESRAGLQVPQPTPKGAGSPSLALAGDNGPRVPTQPLGQTSPWCKLPGLLGQPCSPPWPSDYPVSCSCWLPFYKSIPRFQAGVYLLSFSEVFLSPSLLPRPRDSTSPGSKQKMPSLGFLVHCKLRAYLLPEHISHGMSSRVNTEG